MRVDPANTGTRVDESCIWDSTEVDLGQQSPSGRAGLH
jgi:hypothetical protein